MICSFQCSSLFSYKLIFLSSLLLISVDGIKSQNRASKTSIESLSNSQIHDSIMEHYFEKPEKAQFYLHSYLQRAIRDSLPIRVARCYHLYSGFYYNESDIAIRYLDSSLNSFNGSGEHHYYPAISYMNKGILLERQGKLKEAVDNHLASEQFATAANNAQLSNYAKYNLAVIKKRLKKYKEAQRLLQETISYEEQKDILTYSDSLALVFNNVELIETFRLQGDVEKASTINNSSRERFYRIDDSYLFKVLSGILASQAGQSNESINILGDRNDLLSKIDSISDYESEFLKISVVSALARAHKTNNNLTSYLENLKILDSIFTQNSYIDYRFKKVYKELISFARESGQKPKELEYINKYLYLDSLIQKNFHIIDEKIIEDFDRKELIRQKEEVEENLKSYTLYQKPLIVVSIFCLLILIITAAYQYEIRKTEKKNLSQLIIDLKNNKVIPKSRAIGKSNLNPELISNLLIKLRQFEKEDGYLDRKLTISSLAKKLGTNSKYISVIINTEKNQNFPNYVNNLRVEYLLRVAQEERKFANYTVKALSRECGFNSTEVFSKVFRKKTGVYPSRYFNR